MRFPQERKGKEHKMKVTIKERKIFATKKKFHINLKTCSATCEKSF